MELNDALCQIAEIRQSLARGEIFRGYRSATTAFSAAVALIACAAHYWLRPGSINAFIWVWFAAAALSVTVVAAEMILRCVRSSSALQRQMTMTAVEQFVPCMVAGGLLTYAMHQSAWHALWMLPGLWAILFALGVFASRRVLPRGTYLIGAWYLMTGVLCIVAGRRPIPAPWEMALCFGIGQLMAAFILYWNLERRDARQ